jgi:hypothetical protein
MFFSGGWRNIMEKTKKDLEKIMTLDTSVLAHRLDINYDAAQKLQNLIFSNATLLF